VWVRMLALGLDDGRVVVVDEATGEEKWAVQAHPPHSLVQVAMPPNGRLVASVALEEDDWKIWDAASGQLHRMVATHHGVDLPHFSYVQQGLRAVAFSPCGQRLATRGSSGAVILWDIETGKVEERMQGKSGHAWTIAFTADGARVVSDTAVFDAMTGALLRTIRKDFYVTCVSCSPTNSSMLATATAGAAIQVWDIDSGEIIREIEGCSTVAIFSPDGRTIASARAGSASEVQLMDAETGEMRFRMPGHTRPFCTASWCPYDSSKLASGGRDGTCKLWDSSTGELLSSIHIGGSVWSVVWGRDWVLDTQGPIAFAMGHHPRLGAGSQVLELEAGVVRMILDRV